MNIIVKALIVTILFVVPVQAQQRVIFDTDIDSDVDDVGALAMLYHLHNQKQIHLMGVIVTSDDPYAPTCVSALNHYYGLEELPVGFPENQPALTNHSKYTKQISEEYPRKMKSYGEAEPATQLYRRLLAGSPDRSVVIVTTGHLSNLQNLLRSPANQTSPVNGKSLVETKVKAWYCMGGQFPEGKEANFYRPDPASTVYCLNNWTIPVVFCGWEIGNKVITGGPYLQANLDEKHPVYRAYQLYNDFNGRPSWDQLAVYLLTGDYEKYFQLESQGRCFVETDGSNRWVAGEKTNHSYLKIKPEADISQLEKQIDNMMITP